MRPLSIAVAFVLVSASSSWAAELNGALTIPTHVTITLAEC